jgi:hypothetical protein
MSMLTLAPTARAQDGIPGEPAPLDPLPRFSVARLGGDALAPIGLPLPQIGLPPPPTGREPSRRHRDRVFFPRHVMVFYAPQSVVAPPPPPEPAPQPAEKPAPGRLILEVEPATAQVYADGYYVGAPEDFGAARGGGLIEAGPHRLDVSAAGYEPISVDLRVTAGQPVTYRALLKALPPSAAAPPTTFYLIPGCYMGNIPPNEARLPATCDQTRTVTWLP